MRRTVAAIALVAVLLVGGGVIATAAYQLGVSTAVTTAVTETGATVVTPVVPGYGYPGYGYGPGWGWHGPGFSIFGFLGTILFIFIVIGLLRAVFFHGSGRGWGGPGGPGGPGGWGGPGHRHDRWQGRAREVFDDYHRQAHGTGPDAATEPDSRPPTS